MRWLDSDFQPEATGEALENECLREMNLSVMQEDLGAQEDGQRG